MHATSAEPAFKGKKTDYLISIFLVFVAFSRASLLHSNLQWQSPRENKWPNFILNIAVSNKEMNSVSAKMDQEQWQNIEPILDKALSLDTIDNQKAFLRYACENDEMLYQELLKLLIYIWEADEKGFLE